MTTGKVKGIISNLVTVAVDGPVSQNEICYITIGNTKLMAEVIKVIGDNVYAQVFESTRGLKVGNLVEFFRTTSTNFMAFSSSEVSTTTRSMRRNAGTSSLLPKWAIR